MGKKSIDLLVYVRGYLMVNTKGSVVGIIFIAKRQIEKNSFYTIRYEGYFLKIFDRREYYRDDEIISYKNVGNDLEIGEISIFNIVSKNNTKVCVPLVIDTTVMDFIKRWKDNDAILRRYPQEDWNFSFGLN